MPATALAVDTSKITPFLPQLSLIQNKKPDVRIVFDVGMNNGDDSAYYLSRGFKVVAVEANPLLAQRARARFQHEIALGQMTIENVGICGSPGTRPFWINEDRDVFSSFDRSRATRGSIHCHAIEVDCIPFDSLLRRHGVPHYLKLDVEGQEQHCLACLRETALPQYVSVEAESMESLLQLWELGYRQFKIVDQMRHNSVFPEFTNENVVSRFCKTVCSYTDRIKNRTLQVKFPRGSSGPFGEDISGWQTMEEVTYNWLHLHFGYSKRGSLSQKSWYDFHAKAE